MSINNTQVSLSANARVLRENYGQGICLNTLDQFRDVMKDLGLELHSDFMKDSTCNEIHVKNDVEVDSLATIGELNHLLAPKYFKTVRDNGISFQSINKTEKLISTIYGKYTEMLKNKKQYTDLPIDPNDFMGITRMETKMQDWRTVKKHFKTSNMDSILNSKNVNYIILINIINGQPMDIPGHDLNRFKTLSQLDDYARAKLLFEHCNGDIRLIKEEIRNRLGRNTKPSYQMKKIRNMLPLVASSKGQELLNITRLKKMIKEI